MDQNFILFCFANFFLGVGMAFTHQYRFAAAESVEKDKVPKAISIILLGGIVSAFIGPGLANYAKNMVSEHLYVGSYLSLAALTFIPTILFLFYENNSKFEVKTNYSGRGYLELDFTTQIFASNCSSCIWICNHDIFDDSYTIKYACNGKNESK